MATALAVRIRIEFADNQLGVSLYSVHMNSNTCIV
jgi:hypothetical protein